MIIFILFSEYLASRIFAIAMLIVDQINTSPTKERKKKESKHIFFLNTYQFIYCPFSALISSYDQILQQMRNDAALLTLEDGGSPIQNLSTEAEDARLASLISLNGILKQIKVLVCLFKIVFERVYC